MTAPASFKQAIAQSRAHFAALPRPIRWLLIAAFALFIAGPVTSAFVWFLGRR